jgi:predicted acyltransferase
MAAETQAVAARLVSLDVYRGLAVAGMILVTNAGNWDTVYWPLLHAQWNGWTPTDLIFPSFLFIVGVAMTLSFAGRIEAGAARGTLARHILWRAAILMIVGLFLNGFPFFHLATIRIPGILQRIGLCYLFGGLLYVATYNERARGRVATLAGVTAALLAGYWALLRFVPVPGYGAGRLDSLGNLGAYVDRALFGIPHLWPYGLTPGHGVTYDPEGMLSTLPAIATLLVGVLAGEWLRSDRPGVRKAAGLAVSGGALLLAGLLLDPVLPINKRIWTGSFALFSGGFSLLALALLYWLVDLRKWRGWTAPALIFGTNAIFAFALANMLNPLFALIRIGGVRGLSRWFYGQVFSRFLGPYNASLAWAILFLALNLALLWPLYRKRWFIRI